VVHGDFGTTIGGQPIADELGRRIGVTLRLLVIGTVLGTVIGVVVGAWGAIRQYHLSDRVITVLSLLVISTPIFVLANLLILGALRVNSVLGVQLFEYTGETSPEIALPGGAGVVNQFVDRLQHLVLPTFTLALAYTAGYSRYQRFAMLDVLGQDFIRTARAKGLSRRRALFKHGLRTALIPMATLAGILVVVAYSMSEWRTFLAEFRAPKSDVAVLLTTFLLTVLWDLTVAIEVGMVLAAFLFMRRMAEVTNISALTHEFQDPVDDFERDPNAVRRRVVPPGVEVYEITGPFFFGAAEMFKDRLGRIAGQPKVLILRMRHVPAIDSTGLHALRDLVRRSRHGGSLVILSDADLRSLHWKS